MSGTNATTEQALLGLLNQLWGDAEVGETVRRRAKALNPQITIPEEHPVAVKAMNELKQTQDRMSALEKVLADRDAAQEQARAEADLRAKIAKAQTRYKLTDEGLDGTIKLMQERQISDPEAAAALYVDGLPKTRPTAASSIMPSTSFDLYGTQKRDDAWELLHTDQDAFWRNTVDRVMSDPQYSGQ